jgi:elongation factor 2
VIAGCGELHIEICLNDLEKEYSNIEIIKSDPIVTYKETVSKESSQVCLAKSPNKHNRLFVKAVPLGNELSDAIEGNKCGPKDDFKERAKYLCENFEWEKSDALKIWSFGPENSGPNMLVEKTSGV